MRSSTHERREWMVGTSRTWRHLTADIERNNCEEGEETVNEDIEGGYGAGNLDATGMENGCISKDVEELDKEEIDI